MCQRFIALAAIGLVLSGSAAFAQCGCSSPPVYTTVAPSYSTYYAPAAVDYAPVSYVTSYAPPAAVSYVTYYSPPVVSAPAPYVTYYAPPAPYVTYYSPSVTYAPVVTPYPVYYGRPGWSIYGTPRLYVPGEPVRNTVRAVTP